MWLVYVVVLLNSCIIFCWVVLLIEVSFVFVKLIFDKERKIEGLNFFGVFVFVGELIVEIKWVVVWVKWV